MKISALKTSLTLAKKIRRQRIRGITRRRSATSNQKEQCPENTAGKTSHLSVSKYFFTTLATFEDHALYQDQKGLVYYELLKPGDSITGEQLIRLSRSRIARKTAGIRA